MAHYIVTNRDFVEDQNGKLSYNPKGFAKDFLRFGTYVPGREHRIEGVKLFEDSEEGEIDYSNEECLERGSGLFFKSLYDDMASSRKDTLFFVHGFSNSVDDSLEFVERIEKKYVRDDGPIGQIVLFCWPTNASKLEYRDDASDAVPSGYALARLFRKLAKFLSQYIDEEVRPPCEQEIHLLVQSMGNQVVHTMMQDLAECTNRLPALLEEIILTGADIDEYALSPGKPLSMLPFLGERVHVYVHRRDRALWLSQHTKNRHRRLGRVGPKSFDPEQFVVVDVTHTDEETTVREKLVNHWYFVDVDEVVNDVRAVLSGRLPEEIGSRERHPDKQDWLVLR